MAQIPDIGACVFDAYGTLFDVQSVAARMRDRLGELSDCLSQTWRDKQLQYTWLRSLMGKYTDFWHVTGQSLDHAMHALGITDLGLRARLMEMYLDLKAYPDCAPALARLRAHGFKTAILSNGTRTMLTAAVGGSGLTAALDKILSVEEVGVYKPHPSVYQLAVDRLGVAPSRICFVSANGWDVAGAATYGFRTVWVNRTNAPADELPGQPEAVIRTLEDLPALLGA